MIKKLRMRFIGINMAIVAGMLLIIFALVFHFTRADLESKSDAMLQTLVQDAWEPVSSGRNVQLPYFILQINTWGEIMASGNTHHDLSDREFVQELIQYVYTSDSATGLVEKYHLKYAITSGIGVQRICFLDIFSQKVALNSLIHTSMLTGVIALAAFFFISILLARWAVKPVDTAWRQQKQFVSDASHELKTPLTVIMSNAELLQEQDCDEESRRKFADYILSGAKQMRTLVEGMLELARADNGQIRTNFEPVDLSRTVCDSILPFEPLFFESGMVLQSIVEPDIRLNGSQQHMRQLTDILLDNARKYSDPGLVEIRLCKHGKSSCMLTVSNPGNPIPKEDLKRIFDRFYRADNARTATGSFGLGLSIAQRIVQEHKGQIWAESNETGNRFCVVLPCK